MKDSPRFIINEVLPEKNIFKGQCIRFYEGELDYLLDSREELGNEGVKLYIFLRMLCRNYPAPPTIKQFKYYFPLVRYKKLDTVLHQPGHQSGEHWFLPKLIVRDLLKYGPHYELLVTLLASRATDVRGHFWFNGQTKLFSSNQVYRALKKLEKKQFIEEIAVSFTEKRKKGSRFRWTLLK